MFLLNTYNNFILSISSNRFLFVHVFYHPFSYQHLQANFLFNFLKLMFLLNIEYTPI